MTRQKKESQEKPKQNGTDIGNEKGAGSTAWRLQWFSLRSSESLAESGRRCTWWQATLRRAPSKSLNSMQRNATRRANGCLWRSETDPPHRSGNPFRSRPPTHRPLSRLEPFSSPAVRTKLGSSDISRATRVPSKRVTRLTSVLAIQLHVQSRSPPPPPGQPNKGASDKRDRQALPPLITYAHKKALKMLT